jgi:hypothetical protein
MGKLSEFIKKHDVKYIHESKIPNNMLISNFITKAEKSIKNIHEWLVDLPVNEVREHIESNLATLTKQIEEIKKENNKTKID